MSSDIDNTGEAPRGRFAKFARGPYAVPLMCLLSFADACMSPIIPEVVLVPLVLARPERRWRYAFLVSLMSVLGGACGYFLGMYAWEGGLDQLFFDYVPGFTPAAFEDMSRQFGDQTFWFMFTAGFTPLPYKLFTVAAGVFHQDADFWTFMFASFASRFLRFYLTVWLLHQFGRRVLDKLGKQFAQVFVLLLLIGLLVLLWAR